MANRIRSSAVRFADSIICLSDDPSTKVLGYFHLVRFADSDYQTFFAKQRPKDNYQRGAQPMTWIKTIPISDADEKLRRAIAAQRELYPIEYAEPIHPTPDGQTSSIVASHSLIPDALYHSFATFGALMSPELPLTRRQHEMITTVVSVANRCHY
jgi:hypothetical protein